MIADTAGKWVEYDDVTADFVYVRLHGAVTLYQSRYTEAELDRFAARIRAWCMRPRAGRRAAAFRRARPPGEARGDVFCYFDNTDKIEAPGNAMHLAARARVDAGMIARRLG